MLVDPAAELSAAQFSHISEMLYQLCGISLQGGKEGLVKARLSKRLRALGFSGFDQYLNHVEGDATGRELVTMIDALTTNKTSFFRDAPHFDVLRTAIIPEARAQGGLRLWSAGCSSGEEPYSLGMTLKETCSDAELSGARILATDISTRVLDRARSGVYDEEMVQDVPPALHQRYFHPAQTAPVRTYQVNDDVRRLVRFARLNLMETWPMRGPFDAIFCRNVMIYFDKPTRERLVARFHTLLRPGGYLFVGLSESLNSLTHSFHYVQPAAYQK